MVRDLGAVMAPFQSCENWAYWGVLERVGAAYAIVGADGTHNRIIRVDVTTNTASDIGTWTHLGDMCSITLAPTIGRWYFHHEVDSQFSDPAILEALGYCDATIDTTGGNLHITSLLGTNCNVVEVNDVVGDDRGGIAIGNAHVYLSGDGGLGRWEPDLTGALSSALTPTVLGTATSSLDGLVTNFHGGQVYSLATATELLTTADGGDLTRLVLLATDGTATTTEIALSTPITVAMEADIGIFSGWDELAIHDGTNLWLIALPSGTVTDAGAMPVPSHQQCESYNYFGVLERVGTAHSIVVADENGTDPVIARSSVPDGATTVVETFTYISDMCSFAIGPTFTRWYWHHEDESQLTPGYPSETLGYCDATITHP
jgi:hypothetical protein